MNKRISLLCSLLLGASSFLSSQTVNYALENIDGNGHVSTSAITQLDHMQEMSFQVWINPSIAPSNSKLIEQDNLSIGFNQDQKLEININGQRAILNYSFAIEEWTQISICFDRGNIKAFINNIDKTNDMSGTLPASLPAVTSESCVLAKDFNGKIDEIRIWNKSLDQNDLFWRNTVNKFNNNYDQLIAYWKCDQELCENLVDYKFNHHGVLHGITRKEVADNKYFKYHIATGYTNLIRFIGRDNIDRNMFLMTNDIILLTGKIQQDGSFLTEFADNSGLATNVTHLDEFEGRKGIMNFHGQGSQIHSADGDLFYMPDSKFARDQVNSGTFQGWIYIDEWVEGAKILSKWKSEQECIEIKLGAEATKDIVVNVNGTLGTLSNKISVGKWHFLTVNINPIITAITDLRKAFKVIKIGVDFTIYHGLKEVVLSGNDMTISTVPAIKNTSFVIGQDFSGKMDEIKIWGSDRESFIQKDGKEPYLLNAGDWNNSFLNAYFKGDDPENIGKDYQSYTYMVEFMRKYYDNHRGMKIRLGLIYPNGDKWNQVLNQKANVDRLIQCANEYKKHFDGIDVDLEWHNYNVLNPFLHRLINEVIKGSENMTFSISQHYYSYTLDKTLLNNPYIDYFTMQIYGPQANTYNWKYYEDAYNAFIGYGYPKDKLLLSYSTLLVDGREEGYRNLFEKYGYNDDNFDPNLNSWLCGVGYKSFNGVNQVKRKQEFILDKACRGTMYFDMGNDTRVNHFTSLIRAQNEVIASNVDTLITKVDLTPSGIESVLNKKNDKKINITTTADGSYLTIHFADDTKNAKCMIYNNKGVMVKSQIIDGPMASINWSEIPKGTYLVTIKTDKIIETIKTYK